MRKCAIWGIGAEYEQYVNQIQYQIFLGKISIEVYVSKDKYCEVLDGKKVICPGDIKQGMFEYLIVCNTLRFKEIKKQAMKLGVAEEKILDVEILAIPFFDFEQYAKLMENSVSIIADDCWGAEAYHYLHLPFSSPFILCYMIAEDYMKMLENLDYYLGQSLQCFQEADMDTTQHPMGYLGEGENKVKLYFNHATSFKQAREDWLRRTDRINKDNILVKMTLLSEEMAERFSALPFSNKVGFYIKESKWKDIYYLREWRWNDNYMRRYRGYSYAEYVRNSVRQEKVKPYNILKLLSGEQNFMRKE